MVDLFGTIAAKPEEGRALLKRHLGKVLMTPEERDGERLYHATGAFKLSLDVGPQTKAAPFAGGRSGNRHCGGEQHYLPPSALPLLICFGREPCQPQA